MRPDGNRDGLADVQKGHAIQSIQREGAKYAKTRKGKAKMSGQNKPGIISGVKGLRFPWETGRLEIRIVLPTRQVFDKRKKESETDVFPRVEIPGSLRVFASKKVELRISL